MATHELRPMGIGDILDTTFRLYRQRFLTFLLIALVVYVPYALLIALFQPVGTAPGPVIHQQATAQPRPGAAAIAGPEGGVPQTDLAGAVLGIVGFAHFRDRSASAVQCGAGPQHLGELPRREVDGRAVIRASRRKIAGIVGHPDSRHACDLVGLPPVDRSRDYLLAVVSPDCAGGDPRKSRPVPSAMGRSRELMRGNLGKGFLLGLAVGVLSYHNLPGLWAG